MLRLFILDDQATHTPTSPAFFRVLCIDNNITLLKAYKLGLQRYGFEVIIACHGMDALMQFQAHDGHFRAVITNEMPPMRGAGFIHAIQKMGYEGKVYSFTDFVHRPFDIDVLVMMLLQD